MKQRTMILGLSHSTGLWAIIGIHQGPPETGVKFTGYSTIKHFPMQEGFIDFLDSSKKAFASRGLTL